MKSAFHPHTERLLREIVETLQAEISSLARQANEETCPGARRNILGEIQALREDKKEIVELLT